MFRFKQVVICVIVLIGFSDISVFTFQNETNILSASAISEFNCVNNNCVNSNKKQLLAPFIAEKNNSVVDLDKKIIEGNSYQLLSSLVAIKRSAKSINSHHKLKLTKKSSIAKGIFISKNSRFQTNRISPNIKIAVFIDDSAYKQYAPYFNYNDEKLKLMVLYYMQDVQEIFQHQSLGTSITLTITHIGVTNRLSSENSGHVVDSDGVLDSFCDYQNNEVTKKWDVGLLLTGQNLYQMDEDGLRSEIIGLANDKSICTQNACAIVKLGIGRILPWSATKLDFQSIFTTAHEIGHILGMSHDADTNDCPKNGFIMASEEDEGERPQWSQCSAKYVKNINWAYCLFNNQH